MVHVLRTDTHLEKNITDFETLSDMTMGPIEGTPRYSSISDGLKHIGIHECLSFLDAIKTFFKA